MRVVDFEGYLVSYSQEGSDRNSRTGGWKQGLGLEVNINKAWNGAYRSVSHAT
jgi:hypothetical protein